MNKHCIYISTDSNRLFMEIGYCSNIADKIQEINNSNTAVYTSKPIFNRLVFVEDAITYEAALARIAELCSYTRMQKERIIRRKNPNWLNLAHRQPRVRITAGHDYTFARG